MISSMEWTLKKDEMKAHLLLLKSHENKEREETSKAWFFAM